MSLSMNMAQLHQHQKNLIQQQSKYNNGIAEYNMNKVIRYYKDAINSAETSSEARGLAQSLEGLLTQYGKGLNDVDGLNTNLINGNQTNPNAPTVPGQVAAPKGKKGNPQDRQCIKEINDEFGMKDTHKDAWLQKAKTDQNVRILDKSGKDVTNERDKINKGDILEVNSKTKGKVQIAVGGDGNINGGDDKVIAMGNKAAANGIFAGMNQINGQVPGQANGQITGQVNPANPIANGLFAQDLDQAKNTALQKDDLNMQLLFNQGQIKNMIAAILNQSLYFVEQKEYMNQFAT